MSDDRPLSQAWEAVAGDWAAWARRPGHDSYWRFHRQPFFQLLPAPGRLTLDIGCGEGRVARDLKSLGHNVVAVDVSPTMVRLAKAADPSMQVIVADAAHLPFDDGFADLAVAFMSLHDMDDLSAAVGETSRVLGPGGVLCAAIVHPINSAGQFASLDEGAPFVVEGSYLASHRYQETVERGDLRMTFTSHHRPLQEYFAALESAGLSVEALREPTVDESSVIERADRARWLRLPLFLDLRARKR
ncbi:MAG: class I SAM-dependent methyltransferase [Chloroflexi bacterium]|nr:MAG: class I SAM-dependent methyltransferase [Chloroflexota bacterium]